MSASVRMLGCVRTDGFLPARTVKSVRGVNTDARGRPDEKDFWMVNFTVGRRFRHPCLIPDCCSSSDGQVSVISRMWKSSGTRSLLVPSSIISKVAFSV
jgi:hypothetical protein